MDNEYELDQEELNQLEPIFAFIDKSSLEASALIVNEILMIHPMLIFNFKNSELQRVDVVSSVEISDKIKGIHLYCGIDKDEDEEH